MLRLKNKLSKFVLENVQNIQDIGKRININR